LSTAWLEGPASKRESSGEVGGARVPTITRQRHKVRIIISRAFRSGGKSSTGTSNGTFKVIVSYLKTANVSQT
jgi:hypothetical protein